MVKINTGSLETIERLHIETGIYIKNLNRILGNLFKVLDKLFGYSKEVKGLFYLGNAIDDLRTRLTIIARDELTDFPHAKIYNEESESLDELEEFIFCTRRYKINFQVPKLIYVRDLSYDLVRYVEEDSEKLTLRQHQIIDKINSVLVDTLNQLRILIINRKYDRRNERRLFLAIDRIGKWYKISKKIFIKSTNKMNQFKKITKMLLLAGRFDRNSSFYGVPREIIKIICDFVV